MGPRHSFYSNNSWQLPKEAAKELKKRPFFCRFSVEEIHRFIPKMHVTHFASNQIIYVEKEAGVIMSGFVKLRTHHKA